jgi:hypothetical protein
VAYVPGLVLCRWCQRVAPDNAKGLIRRLTDEIEVTAMGMGWVFELEADEWICPECIERREKASQN